MNNNTLYAITRFILMITIIFFIWKIGRVINYNASYKDMVEKTVVEMVKPEALKKGGK